MRKTNNFFLRNYHLTEKYENYKEDFRICLHRLLPSFHSFLIFIPSAVDRMPLNKQKENGPEATLCCTVSLPCRIVRTINVTSCASADVCPVFSSFRRDGSSSSSSRPTYRARAKFRTVTTVAALLEFQCRNYEPLDIRNTIQRAIVYSSNTKGTKGTKLQKGPAEILASLYCYYRQFFPVTS